MRHVSLPLPGIELLDLSETEISPFISKCVIKVCYLGKNRNHSVISKEVAMKMATSLRGSTIVGYYNSDKEDFEEHNKFLDISENGIRITTNTVPYGFVDLNARVWFQKFLDDGVEHEYLMTEGYLWTKQFPECQRVIDKGNNQSMELDNDSTEGFWTNLINEDVEFFIINEALISKLCILGDQEEPCFEGSTIEGIDKLSGLSYSYNKEFEDQVFSMMREIKELLKKGGTVVYRNYDVNIGDSIWTAAVEVLNNNENYSYIESFAYADEQPFAVIVDKNGQPYRMNFSVSENEEILFNLEVEEFDSSVFSSEDNIVKYSLEDFNVSMTENNVEEEVEDNSVEEEEEENDNNTEEEICADCGNPVSGCTCNVMNNSYNLEEIPEYTELLTNYNNLQTTFSELQASVASLQASLNEANNQITALKEYKATAERAQKQAMIDSFYMLTDENKADVIANIDNYSIDEIEAKLSIICVRNKVSFEQPNSDNPTSYSLNNNQSDSTPEWVKAIQSVQNSNN